MKRYLRLATLAILSASVSLVAHAVNLRFGKRRFRVYIDPADDGAEVVNRVADHIRVEFLRRIELVDLLTPRGA